MFWINNKMFEQAILSYTLHRKKKLFLEELIFYLSHCCYFSITDILI